jgi:23S rRNA pseudouridine2605 synthase
MRLQKLIAHAGVASRRGAEEMIRRGRVTVNGRVVREMGVVVDPAGDAVKCDGRIVRLPSRRHYFMLYKPKGVVSTLSDPEGRPTVRDYLPSGAGRVYPVGRLDWDTEGVLIFTDDGELANRLAHPRYGVERTYHVKVRGVVGEGVMARLREGFRLEDGPVDPEGVKVLRRGKTSTWLTITLREGRHHEVKRLFLALRHPVQKLRRVSYAGLEPGPLRPGESRPLSEEEVKRLRRLGRE